MGSLVSFPVASVHRTCVRGSFLLVARVRGSFLLVARVCESMLLSAVLGPLPSDDREWLPGAARAVLQRDSLPSGSAPQLEEASQPADQSPRPLRGSQH